MSQQQLDCTQVLRASVDQRRLGASHRVRTVVAAGAVTRIETGGAGNYAGWTREQVQTLLGSNPAGGVNLRVMFKLFPPVRLR